MGTKKAKVYSQENLEHFANTLHQIRKKLDKEECYFRINLKGLKIAIEKLPKADREIIEKFWGLTGGTNHSKKKVANKDIAFVQMQYNAITSIKKLFELKYVVIYDEYIKVVLNKIIRKINKEDIQISDLEIVKYLGIFLVFLLNGPKFSFENNDMAVDMECDNNHEYNEYSVICQTGKQLEQIPDNSINVKLLMEWIENLDFRDALAIKKSFNIEIPKEYEKDDDEELKKFVQIRNFKARVFPYGSWNLTSALILEGAKGEIKLDDFMNELNKICKNWSILENYKTTNVTLRTITELRDLDVYEIGGFEFTDPDEVRFLYLARNILAS